MCTDGWLLEMLCAHGEWQLLPLRMRVRFTEAVVFVWGCVIRSLPGGERSGMCKRKRKFGDRTPWVQCGAGTWCGLGILMRISLMMCEFMGQEWRQCGMLEPRLYLRSSGVLRTNMHQVLSKHGFLGPIQTRESQSHGEYNGEILQRWFRPGGVISKVSACLWSCRKWQKWVYHSGPLDDY
jgi:hypothetical protein